MARTIDTIQQEITTSLQARFAGLSTSKVAEWRLWTYIVAASIHAFEVILDLFKSEIEGMAYMSTAGTMTWYAEICRRWQYGQTLAYNVKTAGYDYTTEDTSARIIKMVAISERDRALHIKVAKQTASGAMTPLSTAEQQDFKAYIRKKALAGTMIEVVSTVPDVIRYNLEVYYSAAYPQKTVRNAVLVALEAFKTALSFDAKLYPQQLVERVMSVEGVVTVVSKSVEHRISAETNYTAINIVTELSAGYYDYADDNTLTMIVA